jgi:N-acetylmuramoyl-L-alanine amidase
MSCCNTRWFKVFLMAVAVPLALTGCATTHRAGALPTTRINGSQYVSLPAFCDSRAVGQTYDQLTRIITLTKAGHQVRMVVGDTLTIVDGRPYHINAPVEYVQGSGYVPDKFYQKMLDGLFAGPAVAVRSFQGLGKIRKVVIDAGHGGRDPGATGRTGLREKEVTLDIAKRLQELLKSEGVEATLVRSNDQYVSLDGRVKNTRWSGDSIFVSIHANANPSKAMRGFEVYYITPRVSDTERALSSAREDPLDLDGSFAGTPSKGLKALLWDMIYSHNRAESISLSKSICKVSGCSLDTRTGVKSANYHVLRCSTIPAVLVEVGFLSNYSEERLLKGSEYRQRIAQAINDGIRDFGRAQADASAGRVILSRSER